MRNVRNVRRGWIQRHCLGILTLICAAAVPAASAQTPPAGKAVTDVRKTCQVTVPTDWTYSTGTAYSPDKKISATIHGLRDQTFDAGKTMIKSVMKPIKTIQDDSKRLIYTMDPGPVAPGKSGWYVVANTTPVCSLSFTFDSGTSEATLKTIADSLAPVAAAK
jgi:hypothetical protein